nr:hypothetical protein [Candidatus Levybacteria bacterium]
MISSIINITMTPEEIYNQEVWWILQEIKKEQLYCPKEEKDKVGFSIRTQSEKVDGYILPADVQRKLLNKLKEWGAFDLRQSYTEVLTEVIKNINNNDDNVPSANLISAPKLTELPKQPTKYVLIIHQPKFDEIYIKFTPKEESKKGEQYQLALNKIKSFKLFFHSADGITEYR